MWLMPAARPEMHSSEAHGRATIGILGGGGQIARDFLRREHNIHGLQYLQTTCKPAGLQCSQPSQVKDIHTPPSYMGHKCMELVNTYRCQPQASLSLRPRPQTTGLMCWLHMQLPLDILRLPSRHIASLSSSRTRAYDTTAGHHCYHHQDFLCS